MMNINLYFKLFLAFLVTGMVSSCTNETVPDGGSRSNVRLTLTLGQQMPDGTRAIDNGVDDLNENLIKTVDLFFYRKDAAVTDAPKFSLTDIQLSEEATGTAQLDVSMPVDKFKQLFPTDNDTECNVYVVVNRPEAASGDNALPDDLSLGSLKENTVLYAVGFSEREEQYVDETTTLYHPSVQESFVMDGWATVTRSSSELTGTIPIERIAAKISLIIEGISDEVTDDNGIIWLSDKSSVRLSLRRASVRTKLGTTPTEYIYATGADDLFRMNAVSLVNKDGSMTTNVPFYTYPTNWFNDENARTHFILSVQWTEKGNSSNKITTFYEVNVNAAASYTQRNRHYQIVQQISVLGSASEETPVVLYPSNYLILDWGNVMSGTDATDSDASLSRFRYLVVDETNIEMNNVTSKRIYFASSDLIDLSSVEVKWDYTANESLSILTFATKEHATRTVDSIGDIKYVFSNTTAVEGIDNRIQGDYKVTITIHNANLNDLNDRGYIDVVHPLNNNMDEYADYTSYYIDFVVQHYDNANYNETVKMTQYPMIAIKPEANSVPNTNGGVWVNNRTDSYGSVHGLNGTNKNPNRYIISVSALVGTDDDNYIIGDPRKSSVDNLSTNFANVRTMKYPGDTNNRRLTFYHPTDETDRTINMLSPQFMIASSYGVTNPVSKDDARRRCASYQEDGYPAGRWRLPTQAEIEYIVSLSAWDIIPTLFGYEDGTETTYWSANGAVKVKGNSVSSGTMTEGPVRCVYDTWYWTDKCTKTQFTWGDKEDF